MDTSVSHRQAECNKNNKTASKSWSWNPFHPLRSPALDVANQRETTTHIPHAAELFQHRQTGLAGRLAGGPPNVAEDVKLRNKKFTNVNQFPVNAPQ
jgi:hypothetical protein